MFGVVAALLAGFFFTSGTNIIGRTSHKPNFVPIGPSLAEIRPLRVPREQVFIGRSTYISGFFYENKVAI